MTVLSKLTTDHWHETNDSKMALPLNNLPVSKDASAADADDEIIYINPLQKTNRTETFFDKNPIS